MRMIGACFVKVSRRRYSRRHQERETRDESVVGSPAQAMIVEKSMKSIGRQVGEIYSVL